MRTIDATTKAEKNKPSNQPVYLYTIYDYDGSSNNLYFAEHDADIVYGGVTYTKFPITHDFVGENAQGTIDAVKLSVSNVSREMQAYLETYDLRGKKVDIIVVWADQLADTDAYLKDTYYIDSYTADQNAVEFTLSGRIDVLSVELPCRKFSRTHCSWKFKGTECAYAGATATCDKTLATCRTLQNQLRFGGFPSIPMKRMFSV